MMLTLGILAQPVLSSELTALRPLNSYHAIDNYNANDIAPAVATDDKGHMLAVWLYTENDGVNNHEFTLKSSVSTTSGTTWIDAGQHPLTGMSDENPNLAYIGNGRWLALVQDAANAAGRKIWALSTDDAGETWSNPVALLSGHSGSSTSDNVEIASDGAGNVIVLWSENRSDDPLRYAYLTRSTDFGETWSVPQELTLSSQAGIGREKLAYAGAGKWLMLYRVEVGAPDTSPLYGPLTEFRIASSTDLGANWTELGPVFSNDVQPQMVVLDLRVAGNQAVIAADVPVFPDDYDPSVVLGGDPPNVGTAVWTSNDAGTTFTGPTWLRGPAPLADGTHNYANPVFVSGDADGNWVVTVNDEPNPVWYSNDISTTWTLSQDLGLYFGLPAVAAAGEGNFAIVNSYRDWNSLFDHDNDVRAFISTTAGQSWNEPIPVNNNAGFDPSIISDSNVDMAVGDDMILAAWSADGDVMISRSFDDGRMWDEAIVIPDSSSSYRPRVEWTGALEFSVYWQGPGLSQSVFKTDTVDGGLTWTDPIVVWTQGMDNSPPPVFWHTSLNNTEIQTAGGEKLRVRSVTVAGANNEFTINTYLDVSKDDGGTWTERALIHSQTRVDSGSPLNNTISGEPAILDLGQGRLAVMISNSWIGIANEQVPPRLSAWNLFLVESTDNGQTWSSGIPVYSGSDGVQFGGSLNPTAFPVVFRAADDRIIMAWTLATEYNPNRVNDTDIVYRTRQFGVTTAAGDWQLFE